MNWPPRSTTPTKRRRRRRPAHTPATGARSRRGARRGISLRSPPHLRQWSSSSLTRRVPV
jgi:hypothetical protein